MNRLFYYCHLLLSRVVDFFSTRRYLHTASFAKLHELQSLISDKLDGTHLLLGESIFNYILKVSPTDTQKELANVLLVGRTRSGKSLHIETQLFTWPYSAIVNDVKGELYQRTAGYRKNVVVIDPTGRGHRYDPLEGKYKDADLQSAATTLLYRPDEHEDKIFTERAIVMLTQLFLAARREHEPPLPYVRRMVRLGLIGAATKLYVLNPELAIQFLDIDFPHADFQDKFLLSCWGTLSARMRRLLTEDTTRCFTGSDFTARDIITSREPMTLYLRWPERDLLALSPLVRLIWVSLMDEMIHTYDSAQGEGCSPVLALLDEICRTGMPKLPEYATTVCGRNISLVLPVQSLHQLDASFGKHRAEILRAQMESQIFYRPADQETAEYLETALGYKSGFAHSKTEHEGSVSHGTAEQRIPLMTAQEIKLLSDEDIIGFRSGLRPFRAKRMNWQRFPLLRQRQTIPPPELPLLPQLEENLPDQARPESLPWASWRTDSNLYRKWRPLHTMNEFNDSL